MAGIIVSALEKATSRYAAASENVGPFVSLPDTAYRNVIRDTMFKAGFDPLEHSNHIDRLVNIAESLAYTDRLQDSVIHPVSVKPSASTMHGSLPVSACTARSQNPTVFAPTQASVPGSNPAAPFNAFGRLAPTPTSASSDSHGGVPPPPPPAPESLVPAQIAHLHSEANGLSKTVSGLSNALNSWMNYNKEHGIQQSRSSTSKVSQTTGPNRAQMTGPGVMIPLMTQAPSAAHFQPSAVPPSHCPTQVSLAPNRGSGLDQASTCGSRGGYPYSAAPNVASYVPPMQG